MVQEVDDQVTAFEGVFLCRNTQALDVGFPVAAAARNHRLLRDATYIFGQSMTPCREDVRLVTAAAVRRDQQNNPVTFQVASDRLYCRIDEPAASGSKTPRVFTRNERLRTTTNG